MKKHTLLALLMAAAAPLAAMAHVKLESSIPARDSRLARGPEQLVLVFGEPVELKTVTITRTGAPVPTPLGPLPKAFTEQFALALPRLGEGEYTVTYRYVGSDQHEMTSTLRFRIVAPTAP